MPIDSIQRVSFIGAGTMGCFNSLVSAAAGYTVTVFDKDAKALESFAARQQQLADYLVSQKVLVSQNVLSEQAAARAIAAIRCESDLARAVAEADLVSESVSENLEIKQQVHAELDRLLGPRAILTTNTSNLLVSEIEPAVAHGGRFAALHSHLGCLLFDVVAGSRTDPETIARLVDYVQSLSGVAIVPTKEHRGYLANTLFGAINSTSLLMAASNTAAPEEIDRAWMKFMPAPAGPFGMMDFIGLDVVLDINREELKRQGENADLQQIIAYLEPMIGAGKKGVKSNRGFYDYPGPAFGRPDFLTCAEPRRTLYVTLLRRLFAAAGLLVVGGYGTAEEVDLTWKMTTRASAGPFGILKQHWDEILREEFTVHSETENPDGVLHAVRELFANFL